MHAVSAQVEFTIAIQHLIGIVTGLLLYATVRRLGAPVWVAVVAAAAILLPLDQIVLEHALMNEPLFTLLFAPRCTRRSGRWRSRDRSPGGSTAVTPGSRPPRSRSRSRRGCGRSASR